MFSLATQNVGSLKDLFFYLSILNQLEPFEDTNASLVQGICMYLDPSSWCLQIGFIIQNYHFRDKYTPKGAGKSFLDGINSLLVTMLLILFGGQIYG